MRECPLARSEDLVIEALEDELLVFDSQVDRAHSLNSTAARVWQACDGTRTREQLAEHCELDGVAVELALESLAGCELLVDFTPAPAAQRVSRRTVLRRVAVTGAGLGVALPVIRSITAPSAAMAGTAGVNGPRCGSGAGCSANQYCDSGFFGTPACQPNSDKPARGGGCTPGRNPCVSTSYCSYSGTCRSGYLSQHHSGATCSTNSDCSYSASCDRDGHCFNG